MSYKISKELFEAVMELKVAKIVVSNHMGDENRIHYSIMGREFGGSVLINAFLFKCKKWAFDKFSYEIYTSTTYGYTLSKENNLVHESISLESEQQYCFDACQWILDKEKQ